MDAEQKQRIAETQRKIHVESYTDIAFEGSWKGRSRGMWATAVVGTVAGAAIGALAPLFPVIIGATTLAAAGATMGASLAIFAAIGMVTGFAVGGIVGATSGGVAAVAKEQERRDKGKEIEQAVKVTPGATTEQNPVADQPAPTFTQRIKNMFRDYVNIKPLIAFAVIGALGGALMLAAAAAVGGGAGFLPVAKPVMDVLLGAAATNSTAVAAYTIGVMGTFGALFGINMPKIASDSTRLFGNMLGGKAFGHELPPSSEQERKPVYSQTIASDDNAKAPEGERSPRASRVAVRHYESYKELVAQQAAGQPGELLGKR